MAWTRFPVPEFDHRPLKGLTYQAPSPISGDEAAAIVAAANSGDRSVAGGYIVEPNIALLQQLNFRGPHAAIVLCALPGPGAHLLGRSLAWFNQRAFVLDRNEADAAVLYDWSTPRTYNTRFGPDDGVTLDRAAVWILSGRVMLDQTRANRVMVDLDWAPGGDRQGFRIIAASDTKPGEFHDCCLELSWD